MRLKTKSTNLSIPLTHMADIAYLLLIFIIIFSLISSVHKVPEPLPLSSSGTQGEEGTFTLYITGNEYTFNDKSYKDIRQLVTELKKKEKDIPVTVIAGRRINFDRIKTVLMALKKHDFQAIEFLVIK